MAPGGCQIMVDDLEKIYRCVRELGLELVSDLDKRAWGNVDFAISDPWGNVVCFAQALGDWVPLEGWSEDI